MSNLSPMFDDDYLKNPDDYVTLYRGREHYWSWELPKTQEDLKGLGMHWTTEPRIAAHFGAGWNDMDNDEPNEKGKTTRTAGGHIITARVHKSGIIERGTPEWHKVAWDHGILGAGYEGNPDDADKFSLDRNIEKEVTVRPGTPLYVTNVTPIREFGLEASPALRDVTGAKRNKPVGKIKGKFQLDTWGTTLTDKKSVEKGGYVKRGPGTA